MTTKMIKARAALAELAKGTGASALRARRALAAMKAQPAAKNLAAVVAAQGAALRRLAAESPSALKAQIERARVSAELDRRMGTGGEALRVRREGSTMRFGVMPEAGQ